MSLDVELAVGNAVAEFRQEKEVYLLTSSPGVPTSRDVLLNGKVLRLADERTGELPSLPPLQIDAGKPIHMAAKSYGFCVLPNAAVPACSVA